MPIVSIIIYQYSKTGIDKDVLCYNFISIFQDGINKVVFAIIFSSIFQDVIDNVVTINFTSII